MFKPDSPVFHRCDWACAAALLAALLLPASLSGAEKSSEAERNPIALIKQLESGDRDTKREATYQLARLGERAKDAVPALIVALGDDDKQVWSNAVTALANLGPAAEPAIPALIESMDS
ncbi:MAG: HEAT repeat domain-containing protein, partial [Verrucomicrobiaceae bacterium]